MKTKTYDLQAFIRSNGNIESWISFLKLNETEHHTYNLYIIVYNFFFTLIHIFRHIFFTGLRNKHYNHY